MFKKLKLLLQFVGTPYQNISGHIQSLSLHVFA